MTNTLLEVILQDTFTKNLALKRVAALRNHLVNKLFKASESKAGKNITEDPEITTWVLNLNPETLHGITASNVYKTFDNLEASIKLGEPLILYLPYELPAEEIMKIGYRLRADYGLQFLMDIQIDPNLIAGCALSYKGIYKDFSVKQKILDNKKEILAGFRKYVKH